jgi:FkbM family methyltransferase
MSIPRTLLFFLANIATFLSAACPNHSQYGQGKYPHLPFQSQFGQDIFLYETCFGEEKNGIFVDIGACDPIKFSNSYFFENHLGWNGICIEPIHALYEKLKSVRSCLCIHGCISDKVGPVPFLQVNGYPYGLSGILENLNPNHINWIDQEIVRNGGSKEIILIESYNLSQILEENNIAHIDYLSIDTEGSEMSILRTIDFNRFDISVIGIENNTRSNQLEKFLRPLGYKKIAVIGVDEIYKKR